jgi:exodeoxyribonuclease-3
VSRWIGAGWIDTFRRFEKGPHHYSWWSQRFGVRKKNIGWRLDYVLCSPNVLPYLRGGFLHPHVLGSDHCPAGVDLDPAVLA